MWKGLERKWVLLNWMWFPDLPSATEETHEGPQDNLYLRLMT
jgi:hypothetical protein